MLFGQLGAGAFTPSSMVPASVLGLESLGWQSRIAAAVPYSVGEETSERNFLDEASFTNSASATAFEHDVEWEEKACCVLVVLEGEK